MTARKDERGLEVNTATAYGATEWEEGWRQVSSLTGGRCFRLLRTWCPMDRS